MGEHESGEYACEKINAHVAADMLNRDEGGMGCANFAVESNLARVVVHETQSDDGGSQAREFSAVLKPLLLLL